MPVQSIEDWAAPRIQNFPFTSLRHAVVGVDASYYLDLRLNSPTSIEPLLNATGGNPYTLKLALRDDLAAFKTVDASLIFVFDGLDFPNKELHTSPRLNSTLKAHKDGWKEYYNKDNGKEVAAERTLKAFAKASYPVEKVTKYFQSLLNQHSVPFMVAPYSAAAQLAYLERGVPNVKQESTQFIDAMVGSTDLFLFDVERVITGFSTRQGPATFYALSKSACQERLDRISDDVFRDVQLLLGGQFLPTFPPLDKSGGPKVSARDALIMLNGAGRSVIQLCNQWREDPLVQGLDYEDKYKRALLSLKHHVVLDRDGKAMLMGPEYDAGDAHEFIGLRLPEELYFYISRAMLGPRIPNWLASGEIDLTLPVGCEDTEAYRRLLGDQLTSLHTQTICLLSNSMNRFYQSRTIKIKTWFSRQSTKTINVKEEPSVKDKIGGWKVPETVLLECFPGASSVQASFARCVRASNDPKFRQATSRKDTSLPLKSKSEILFNVMGRFLQLRGFLNEKRELTAWGRALQTALSSLDAPDKLEDAVYLALEMLRLGLLDDRNFVLGSTRSRAEDVVPVKTLVTKVACLGRLKHGSIGYSGPLDREVLAFQHMINAVRNSLRDLLETVLVSMCLSGEIDRNRSDWSDLSFSLPLLSENSAGLAIAVSTYFDDVKRHGKKKDESTPSEDTKEEVKSNFGWLPQVPNITKNLRNAFQLWDAVYQGSKEANKEVQNAKQFEEANTWLSTMR